jgi:hypothetical protein
MKRYQVHAPNIVSLGYDEVTEILEIEFKFQAIHHYFGVTINEFVALMKATEIETHYFDCIYSQYHFNVF